jgi:hypothetical protein
MGVSRQLHALAALPPGNIPHTHWRGGWVGPRTGLDPVALAGNLTPVVQLVAFRYTDWAIAGLVNLDVVLELSWVISAKIWIDAE